MPLRRLELNNLSATAAPDPQDQRDQLFERAKLDEMRGTPRRCGLGLAACPVDRVVTSFVRRPSRSGLCPWQPRGAPSIFCQTIPLDGAVPMQPFWRQLPRRESAL
jgi:hypothetical protein